MRSQVVALAPLGLFMLGSWGCTGGSCPDCTASVELCDGLDNDGDGFTDEDDAADAASWYTDADGDGIGGALQGVSCAAPSGAVLASGDCDDSDPLIHPGAPEDCDGVDDDCSGAADDAAESGWAADPDRWERVLYLYAPNTYTWASRFTRDEVSGNLWTALSSYTYVYTEDELGDPTTLSAEVQVALLELTEHGPVLHDVVLSETYALVHDLAVDADGTVWIVWSDADSRGHLTSWSPGDYPSSIWLNAYGFQRIAIGEDGPVIFATIGTSTDGTLVVFDQEGTTLGSLPAAQAWDVAAVDGELWVAGAEDDGDEAAMLWRWTGSDLEELLRYDYTGDERFYGLAQAPSGEVWLSWELEATNQDLWSLLTVSPASPSTYEVADAVDYGVVRITHAQVDVHPFAGGIGGAWINDYSQGGVVRIGQPDAMSTSMSLPYDVLDGLGVDGRGEVWVASRFSFMLGSYLSFYRLSCL